MQHSQRKVGWQGGQRGKVGNQAAKGDPVLVGWLVRRHLLCCVTTVFIEFPAGQTLTRPCLNLLKSVKVDYVPCQASAAVNYSQLN